ncbi:MAG: exo-alpha-sialidase [Bacteroidetes bacterium]|nr:exo-alpha-sialidase [Bacteroidota bacterium]
MNGLRRSWFVLFLLLSSAPVAAQTTLVDLMPDGVETNEPCIAIDPANPAIQILGGNTSLFFVSQDGGFTWSPRDLNPKEGFYGDPVVFISRKGIQYLAHLSQNPAKKWPEQFDRIVFEHSKDGGNSFISTGVGFHPGKVQDKPWMAVDESKKSKYRDRVYLSWTEFDAYGSKLSSDSSRIRVSWSDDEGSVFAEPVVVSDTAGDAADDDNTLEGATIATGPKGEVYCVWAGKGRLWFDKSLDGGKTWGKDNAIDKQVDGWNQNVKGLMRTNSMPFLTANKKGWLFLVFGDKRNGDYDVFLKVSKDGGITWTEARRLNNDGLKNGRDQYMPSICRDRKTDRMYITWYDRRHSENNLYTDVYVARFKGEKTGRQMRITNQSFCAPGRGVFFGDYISVAAERKEVRIAPTLYDHDKAMATVQVALLNDKILKKVKSNEKPPFLQVLPFRDSGLLSLHFELPGYTSCTVKIKRGEQLFFTQLFEGVNGNPQELLLPLSKFSAGVYRVILSFKGREIERNLYLEGR